MKLSDTRVRNAKAGSTVAKMADGGGLFIQVEITGSKLWRFSYRFVGKQKTISMGQYPATTLAQARVKRDAAKALLAQGVDPSAARRAQPIVEVAPSLATWKEVAEEFAKKQANEGRAARTLDKLDWLLRLTYPALGTRPISQITRSEVLKVLKLIEERAQYVTANRLRNTISQVFRYAMADERADTDPASYLRDALTTPTPKHHAAITDPKGIGGLMRVIRGYEGDPATRVGLLLCAYTFMRPGEVRNLEWGDIDTATKRVTIPADRMKARRVHVVPLSTQVSLLLESMRPITGHRRLVLSSGRTGGGRLSENTFNAALRRVGYDGETHVSHGFRTTASTLLNEQSWNRDWIERQLAHVEGSSVRAAYNAAEYLEGRTQMMQSWADYLDGLADAPA